jgi:tetratricopeptide (TPR) repeat protein
MAAKLQEAIGHFEKAAEAYKGTDQKNWVRTQNNLGAACSALPTGDRAANLQKAIDAFQAAPRVTTEKDFPIAWATTQNNLGIAYSELPTGDRAANLQKAIDAFQAALRVTTEKDFPADWAETQKNLGETYTVIPGGNRPENLKSVKAYFEAALSPEGLLILI